MTPEPEAGGPQAGGRLCAGSQADGLQADRRAHGPVDMQPRSDEPAALIVRRAGPLTMVQDRGRPGRASQGIARSGAADRAALGRANDLVGNREVDAGLEVTLGGLEAQAFGDLVVAVTGATCEITLSDPAGAALPSVVPSDVAVRVPGGARLALGRARTGLRAYLAVRGGIDVPPVLGSRSWDSLGRFGPRPLQVGDQVPIGDPDGLPPACWVPIPSLPIVAAPVVRVVPGWRPEWFDEDALERLVTTTWTVQPASDRTGLRLGGGRIPRRSGDMASEATIVGAIQVPPDGCPVVLGTDCGTTGGYPVLAVVRRADLGHVAQVRPGGRVHFEVR